MKIPLDPDAASFWPSLDDTTLIQSAVSPAAAHVTPRSRETKIRPLEAVVTSVRPSLELVTLVSRDPTSTCRHVAPTSSERNNPPDDAAARRSPSLDDASADQSPCGRRNNQVAPPSLEVMIEPGVAIRPLALATASFMPSADDAAATHRSNATELVFHVAP